MAVSVSPILLIGLKLLLVPLLILAISLAGVRFGPRVAGVLTGLPVIAGPVSLLLALERGGEFAAAAAVSSLAGELSLAVFCVVYASVCLRWPWWIAVATGWLGFAASTLLLRYMTPTLWLALLLAWVAPWIVLAFTPSQPSKSARAPASPAQLAGRMAAGAALVLILTALAPWLGPRLSGLLTIFPVATSVLAIASHRSQGAEFAVQLLRGLGMGLYSITAFFAGLALALEPLGMAPAFLIAAASALIAQAVTLRVVRWRAR